MVYATLNERQEQLCRDCGIDPKGLGVDYESKDCLRMHHYKSGNEVVIWKGIAQQRREQSGN